MQRWVRFKDSVPQLLGMGTQICGDVDYWLHDSERASSWGLTRDRRHITQLRGAGSHVVQAYKRSLPWSVPCRPYHMIYIPRLRRNCIRVGSRQRRGEDLKAPAGNVHRRSGGWFISHGVQFYTDTNSRKCFDRCSGLEDEKPVGVPISCSGQPRIYSTTF